MHWVQDGPELKLLDFKKDKKEREAKYWLAFSKQEERPHLLAATILNNSLPMFLLLGFHPRLGLGRLNLEEKKSVMMVVRLFLQLAQKLLKQRALILFS